MLIGEQGLANFSRPVIKYDLQGIIDTYKAIDNSIKKYYNAEDARKRYKMSLEPSFNISLQGSYRNNTNVEKNSLVDFFVELTTVWVSDKDNLPPDQLKKYSSLYGTVDYSDNQLMRDISLAISKGFDKEKLNILDFSIELQAHDGFYSCSIVPCKSFRKISYFKDYSDFKYEEGVHFMMSDNISIVSFPTQHYDKLIYKNQNTNGLFFDTLRMFKGIRNHLLYLKIIDQYHIGSYCLENLLYNIPNHIYKGNYTERFINILGILINKNSHSEFISLPCANEIDKLGDIQGFTISNLEKFIKALVLFRDDIGV